ncbi:MAG: HDOD domain-containing protein [Gammaproteobacteria bacterium]|nr:HDOD domain-containing protein [Gammaproteobacteria bacterium]
MSGQDQSLGDELKRLINTGGIEVPMLPEIANKALVLAQNPDSDASEMAALIQGDQSLAAHVMRIANSVAFTPLSNLVSLQQAIARLGMATISEIALTAAIGAKMFNTPGYEEYVAGIWKHALATSLWSKEIARHGRSNVEVAFLAGLLHSIGRPAVLQAILDLAKKQNVSLSKGEVQHLENSYCQQVSQAVVHSWKMPTLVIEAISAYTDQNSDLPLGLQAAQITVGSRFATHMLKPENLDKEILLMLPALDTLNLYQDEVETLLGKTEMIKGRLEGLSS